MPNVSNPSSPRPRAISLDQSNDSAPKEAVHSLQRSLNNPGLSPTRPRAVSFDTPQNNDSAPKKAVNFRPRSFSHPGICPKRSKSYSPISKQSNIHLSYDPEINPVPLQCIEQDNPQLLYRKPDSPSHIFRITTFPDPNREVSNLSPSSN